MTFTSTGTGPGQFTPDGCAVSLYALLPPGDEAEIVHAALPAGAGVLELGCGTGRILRGLAALGHSVVGVDESADMLAHAADLTTVRSPIQTLALGRRFDAVLLASTLVNTPDPDRRAAMLAVARRHTVPGGSLVIQRHSPQWFDTVEPRRTTWQGIRITVGAVHRTETLLSTTVEYEAGGERWTHAFTAYRLSDDELGDALRAAEFVRVRWLTEDHAWLAAS